MGKKNQRKYMTEEPNAKKPRKTNIIVSGSQSRRNDNSVPLIFLPDDLIIATLSRLPAKYLHKVMRYVCNSWVRMIREPYFVETQLQLSKTGLFVQNSDAPFEARFLEFKGNGDLEITSLNPNYPGEFSCSSDGVSVFREASGQKVFYVANPIMMDVVEVPICDDLGPELEYSKPWAFYGIARLPNKGGFKLVAAYVGDHLIAPWYIRTLGIDDSWRKIGSVNYKPVSSARFGITPISIGQFIYWTPTYCNIPGLPCEVVITDIVDESVRKYSARTGDDHFVLGFLKMGNSFAYVKLWFRKCAMYIYVSKDVPIGIFQVYHKIVVKNSSIERSTHWILFKIKACLDQRILIFEVRERGNDGRPTGGSYLAFNTQTGEFTSLGVHINFEKDLVHLHTNSLVSHGSV